MATLRGGYGLPARPSDGFRPPPKRPGTLSTTPRSFSLNTAEQQGDDTSHIPRHHAYSKLPGSATQPTLSSRQRQSHRLPSSGSSSFSDSSKSRLYEPSKSLSSTSSRSNDSSSKPDNVSSIARKVSTYKQPSLSTDSSRNSDSSPTRRRSRLSDEMSFQRPTRIGMVTSPKNNVAHSSEQRQATMKHPTIYPELDRYRNHDVSAVLNTYTADVPYRLMTQDLPPPTPGSMMFSGSSSQVSMVSGSPSTKFSESPGPGPYSRDTTPTSISSQSPIAMSRIGLAPSKFRQVSPIYTRPPVAHRNAGVISNEAELASDPHGLAAVREASNSASSNSTIRDGEKGNKASKKSNRKPPPPPSPPPRVSSQNFRESEALKHQPKITGNRTKSEASQLFSPTSPKQLVPPSRPSRDGTEGLNSEVYESVPVIKSRIPAITLSPGKKGSDPTSSSKAARSASTSNLPETAEQLARKKSTKSVKSAKIRKHSESGLPKPGRSSSPSPTTSINSRFPFFSRKKSTADGKAEEKRVKESKKTTRKGPAAGTGHEGYGRVGNVRRRSGGSAQSPQTPTNNYDSFFADRMNPVVIPGGGAAASVKESPSILTRSESNYSMSSRPSVDSQDTSESFSANASSNSLWPSAMPRLQPSSYSVRRPSDSSGSDMPAVKTSLALRRSMQRLKGSLEDPLPLPQPINTSNPAFGSPLTSFDTGVFSDDSHSDLPSQLSDAHPAPRKLKKREPSKRSPRKWNPFSRSDRHGQKQANGEVVAATVTAVEHRQVPFYALMDSPPQASDDALDNVQDVLRNADINLPASDSAEHIAHFEPYRIAESSSFATAHQPTKTVGMLASGRPSRLPQVGRIPLVVSNRPSKERPVSFSRPFRTSAQPSIQIREYHDSQSIATGPSPPKSSTPVPDLGVEGSVLESRLSPELASRVAEFIAFSPRKNSVGTVTSSGSSHYGPFTGSTAIIPNPNDPPEEDEVWDEYDDLLVQDEPEVDVDKPLPSATSSKGTPFHLERYHKKLDMTPEPEVESPTVTTAIKQKCSRDSLGSSICSEDMTERLKYAFQPHQSITGQLNAMSQRRASKRHSVASSNRTRFSDCSSASSDHASPLAQVNLRVGSMSVSKWLTFGHVLFSDLRHELVAGAKASRKRSVLVVDGLGNDDWSFYAAETYPAADFFNLSPRAPVPEALRKGQTSMPITPENHHQVQYLSHTERFPFDAESFDSVVYRFPAAAPEASYRNILSEARRVLRPEGFVELALLDLDLNNMGNRGRRAVRHLKECLHEAEPKTNLASTADCIVRMLGNTGFSSIRAAKVGIPVASSATQMPIAKAPGASSPDKTTKLKEPPSLSEMMRDPSPDADAGITKMVSRVGRWWYARCYESTAKSKGSIWDDRALLCECEELGTSLKLTVCCARSPTKPTKGKGRAT